MTRTLIPLVAAAALLLTSCGGLTNSPVAPAAAGGELSTDACVDPAAATAVIDDVLKVGWTVPLSGPFAGTWSLITDGFAARMRLFNAEGGAGGVPVEFLMTDSQLDPEIAKAMGNQLVQRDGADVLFTTGSAQVATMVDDAAAACVPFVASASSTPLYRDPAAYPWTTLYLPPTTLEARAIVGAIQRSFPDGATVGIARSPSESGQIYTEAFMAAIEGTNVTVIEEANLLDPNAAATTLKASGADVLFNASSAQECLAMSTAIGRVGWKPVVYQNSTCADSSLYAPLGEVTDGQLVFKYEVVPTLAEFRDTPAVQQYLADAATHGLPDPNSNWSVTGWSIGEVYADLLATAGESPDGLTRLSIMQAARAQDFHPSTFLDGIDFDMTTGGVTGMQPFEWDSATQQFAPSGEPVIING